MRSAPQSRRLWRPTSRNCLPKRGGRGKSGARQVPNVGRFGPCLTAVVCFRTGHVAPRVQLLSEAECAGLRGSGEVAAGEVLRKLRSGVPVSLEAAADGLCLQTVTALPAIARRYRHPDAAGEGAAPSDRHEDGRICGVVGRADPPSWLLHTLRVEWAAAARWRAQQGLPERAFAITLALQRAPGT